MSMGGSFLGMDTVQVRSLATDMDTTAETLRTALGRLSGKLGQNIWHGPDASKFRSEWDGVHVKHLNTLILELKGAAELARKNATQQDTASA